MTRVLHIITGLDRGGAEQQLLLLLRHLPVTSEVAVLTGDGALSPQIEALGVPVHRIGMRGNTDLAALPALVRLIRRGRYDVVHTHLYRACVYGRLAARLAGVRHIVATEHSLGTGHIEGRATTRGVRRLYRATERLGTVTVAVSPTVAERLAAWGVPRARIVTIPNGVDAAAFAYDGEARARVRARFGLGERDFVVGTVGRLVPTKNVDVLIDAMAATAAAVLLVVGDGPAAAELRARAARSPAAPRIVFAGETGHVADALAAMDVFASASTQETFGLGVVEALAAGLPVLYAVCPALEDLPAGHAPHAERLRADAAAFGAAIQRLAMRRPERFAPPPAVEAYAAGVHAARLAALYGAAPAPLPDPAPAPAAVGSRTAGSPHERDSHAS
ncbi:glycosyltransferase [Actinomadura parmotrematis]|uniref:Glycosyltransferase n=1 Tax=Actinomadura parmotrematis TaxID=2864039 RepID=A0ABS7G2F4_9ACTN|nr:glycosyltransferase [Actinomadura parmotrematis]MBW8486898.1 glycosyltransferase [Actinomadura parmotrematis]